MADRKGTEPAIGGMAKSTSFEKRRCFCSSLGSRRQPVRVKRRGFIGLRGWAQDWHAKWLVIDREVDVRRISSWPIRRPYRRSRYRTASCTTNSALGIDGRAGGRITGLFSPFGKSATSVRRIAHTRSFVTCFRDALSEIRRSDDERSGDRSCNRDLTIACLSACGPSSSHAGPDHPAFRRFRDVAGASSVATFLRRGSLKRIVQQQPPRLCKPRCRWTGVRASVIMDSGALGRRDHRARVAAISAIRVALSAFEFPAIRDLLTLRGQWEETGCRFIFAIDRENEEQRHAHPPQRRARSSQNERPAMPRHQAQKNSQTSPPSSRNHHQELDHERAPCFQAGPAASAVEY